MRRAKRAGAGPGARSTGFAFVATGALIGALILPVGMHAQEAEDPDRPPKLWHEYRGDRLDLLFGAGVLLDAGAYN